jgi:hypothetical protein
VFDCPCKTSQTCIDQNPFTIAGVWLADKNYIHDRESFIGKIVSDLVSVIVIIAVNLWMIRATFLGKRNLFAHGCPEPPAAP